MHLPGRLSSSSLGDLLGSLYRQRITGTVELTEACSPQGRGVPGRLHRVHLRGGLVVAVDTAIPVLPLGEILRRDGQCSREAVRLLVTRIEAGDRRAAGVILESAGLASAETIRGALHAQLRERVDALFTLEDARVAFRTARPLPLAAGSTPLSPVEFLHGRPRHRDQGARVGARTEEHTPPPPSGVRPVRSDLDPADEHARLLLGLPRGAAVSDVRRAFRRLASALHPDRIAGAALEEQERSAARFVELATAYHRLVA
jgi:hypothetical protein